MGVGGDSGVSQHVPNPHTSQMLTVKLGDTFISWGHSSTPSAAKTWDTQPSLFFLRNIWVACYRIGCSVKPRSTQSSNPTKEKISLSLSQVSTRNTSTFNSCRWLVACRNGSQINEPIGWWKIIQDLTGATMSQMCLVERDPSQDQGEWLIQSWETGSLKWRETSWRLIVVV